MTEMFESFDGTQLAVHRTGSNTVSRKPLLMLHGLFSSAHMNWIKWKHDQTIADRGFEVIMLDFRVHGDSDAPRDPANYPTNVLVRDVAALVDHLGLEDYALGGFSLGARTSLYAVAQGILTPSQLIVAGMGTSGLNNWAKRAAHFKRIIDEFDTMTRDDSGWFGRQFLKSQGVDRVAARLLLDTMPEIDIEKVAQITMPTLVVCGDEDSDNGSAEDLANLLPNATFKETPGNHLSSATKPEMGLAIADWLGATQ